MLDEFLGVDGVEITAVCDIVKDKVTAAQRIIEKAGQKTPAGYTNGDHDFENLCKRGGHGGMDFIMVYRLIECLRKGLAPDLNVYDAAA
jgi:hypothetical protein